jgi:hypothetical protein
VDLIVYVADTNALLGHPFSVAIALMISVDETIIGPLYAGEFTVG